MRSEVDFDVRAFQMKCLEIMDTFDAVCRANGLRYYMACGTMLGAVRHKGFIPWDDDVDVYMPRPDYDRLVKNARKWLPAPLKMVECESDITFPHYYGKIEDESTTMIERVYLGHFGGVWIDIFPVDGVTDCKLLRKLHVRRFKFWRKMLYYVYRDPWKHGRTPGGYMVKAIHAMFSKQYVHRKLQNVIRQYDFESHNTLMPHNDKQKTFTREILGEHTEYDFEGRKYYGVKDYDKYLTIIFGDYMTLPPVEQRVVHHNLVCCDLNRSYKEYMREHGIQSNG